MNYMSLAEFINIDFSDKIGLDGQKQLGMLMECILKMNEVLDGVLIYSKISKKNIQTPVDLNALVKCYNYHPYAPQPYFH